MNTKVLLAVAGAVLALAPASMVAQTVDLPTSKQLIGEIPGPSVALNSLPMTMAVSPDRRFVVTVNAGLWDTSSRTISSRWLCWTRRRRVEDFPDARTLIGASQTLYSGLAFSRDGRHSMPAWAPSPRRKATARKTGSGVVVYSFRAGKSRRSADSAASAAACAGQKTKLIGGVEGDKGVPFPAAMAVVGPADPAEKLLVADNLSDDVLLMDAPTGVIEKRFDLSESNAVPSTYPIALAVPHHGGRAFVALWNSSEIVELDLVKGRVGRKLALLKPQEPGGSGHASLRLRAFAG
jgi:hypothetical protein